VPECSPLRSSSYSPWPATFADIGQEGRQDGHQPCQGREHQPDEDGCGGRYRGAHDADRRPGLGRAHDHRDRVRPHASAIGVNDSNKVFSDGHFVFFNNLKSPDDAIVLSGDNRTGEGEGDDESIVITLANVPAEITKIVVPVSIYDAVNRAQNFGQVRNAYIRVVDQNGTELVRYDLSEDYSTETVVIFGEVYRNGADWKFRAVGQGHNDLAGLARDYGVNV